jgi:O-antigen/teichoic acid export membrane protein
LATLILLFVYPQTVSLILGIMVGVLFELLFSFVFTSPRPKLEINKEYLKLIINNGKWITGTVILNYGYERGDNITVGRMLSSHALGIYDMAYRIAMLPLTELAEMLVRVVFPVFVKISDDYERLKRAFLRTVISISLIVVPFGLILFFFTEEIVVFVLGEKWIEVVPILKVLVVLGVVKAIANAIMSLQLALRMQKYITLTTLIGLAGMVGTIIPLISQFGIIGAAYAASFGYFLSVPFIVYFTVRGLRAVKKAKK